MKAATSRRYQLRSVETTLLCACVLALMPFGSVFAQDPCMERWGHDAQIRPDRSGPIYRCLDADDVRLEPPHSKGAGSPASDTVTLHELSHHVPGRAEKEYKRALKATDEGEQGKAIEHYQKAIAADPEYLAAINNLGVAYLDLNRMELAIEQFTKAIAVDPHSGLPRVNLAIVYLRLGQFDDAERTARRAVDLDRGDRYVRMVLGISSILKGKFTADVERSLTEAAQEYNVAKIWLAIGLIGKGDFVNARDHLRTYVAAVGTARSDFASSLLQEIESASQVR